jgi:hypothetical protein
MDYVGEADGGVVDVVVPTRGGKNEGATTERFFSLIISLAS